MTYEILREGWVWVKHCRRCPIRRMRLVAIERLAYPVQLATKLAEKEHKSQCPGK